MKKILLAIGILITANNYCFSQIKKIEKQYQTVELNDSLLISRREVSLKDWIEFIASNKFDSTLFPINTAISSNEQILFANFKKLKNLKYDMYNICYILVMKKYPKDTLNPDAKEVYLRTKPKKELFQTNDSTYFDIDIPITGITYQQALAFCKWKEKVINYNQKVQVKVSLPSIEIYKQILDNKDSLNPKKCSLYNFKDCNCQVEKSQRDRKSQGKCLQPVYSYWPNNLGLYNLQGNAAEMTSTENIAIGGSFRHSARETFSDRIQEYKKAEDWLGFRYIVTIIDKK